MVQTKIRFVRLSKMQLYTSSVGRKPRGSCQTKMKLLFSDNFLQSLHHIFGHFHSHQFLQYLCLVEMNNSIFQNSIEL